VIHMTTTLTHHRVVMGPLTYIEAIVRLFL